MHDYANENANYKLAPVMCQANVLRYELLLNKWLPAEALENQLSEKEEKGDGDQGENR